MAIIGVSGKDTVGKIIQYLTSLNTHIPFIEWIDSEYNNSDFSNWKIVKFTDTLKSMMCIILAEPDFISKWEANDNNYRDGELGEEWWYYKINNRAKAELIPYLDVIEDIEYYNDKFILIKLTRRKLQQLLSTDCGKNIIHSNIWVNSTMNNYKAIGGYTSGNMKVGARFYDETGKLLKEIIGNEIPNTTQDTRIYPNWIITDVRFPNEVKAIEDRDGFIIRCNKYNDDYDNYITQFKLGASGKESKVGYEDLDSNQNMLTKEHFYREDRPLKFRRKWYTCSNHESETALGNYKAKYTVDNNGTIEELIVQVKNILIKEEVL